MVREWPDHRLTVEQVLPRRTAVVRATAGEQSHGQVLCANVDLAAVVVALHPLPVPARVDRLLSLAWGSGARPLVVLTKDDVVSDGEQVAEDLAAELPDVEVLRTSTVTGLGIDRLAALVAGGLTLALLGLSGHGKSSLVNALVGTEVLGTRAIRDDGRGRHTSVRRELVVLPGGGAVIDTPGLRGIGLIDEGGLAGAFADVVALAAGCRFRDCTHRSEPGCAVNAALEDGTLSRRRYESWRMLLREADAMAARKTARLRGEQNRERKRRMREQGTGR